MTTAVETRIGYLFKNADLRRQALTHPSSHTGKKILSSYERLEFLGDRVLSLVIAQWLYEVYGDENEGGLAKRHSGLVNRDQLAGVADMWGLEDDLQIENKDDLARGRVNILSDAVEAMLGAIYLDAGEDGLRVTSKIIRRDWQEFLNESIDPPQDSKSALQEWAQGKGLPLPVYSLVDESGPAHAPLYVMQVEVRGMPFEKAEGHSKREAEKKAAAFMLAKIKEMQ